MEKKRFKNPSDWTQEDYHNHSYYELCAALDEWKEYNRIQYRDRLLKKTLGELCQPKGGE